MGRTPPDKLRPDRKANPNKTPLTPEQYAKAGTEHAHQVALFMWAADTMNAGMLPDLRWMTAIPNGGLRDKATAGRLKAEGVKAGFPDIFLAVPAFRSMTETITRGMVGQYLGLMIELKKPKVGRVQDNQNEWRDHLNATGYKAVVCYGWEAARDQIILYLTYNGTLSVFPK